MQVNEEKSKDIIYKIEWNEEKILNEYSKIIELCGNIPSFGWLQSNGYSSLHDKGKKIGLTLPQIREKLNVTENLRIISCDGQSWRSLPECAIANFLLCRGVKIKSGELYPKEFIKYSGLKKAQYDMHIIGESDNYYKKTIDIEIWGGGIRYNDDNYKKTKEIKEKYNKNRLFIGIDYKDSYNEKKLINIFKPFIGVKDIIIKHTIYPQILSTQFSIVNNFTKLWEMYSKHLKYEMPSIDWFRRIQVYKNRDIGQWEPNSFSCFIWHITKLGGMVKIRKLLKISRRDISAEQVVKDTIKLFELTGKTPGAVVKFYFSKKNRTDNENELYKLATSIASKAHLVGGHKKLCDKSGVLNLMKEKQKAKIQKDKEFGLKACNDFYKKYNLTPGTMFSQLYKLKSLTKEQIKISSECNKLISISKLFGGQTNFYKLAGLSKKNGRWIK